MYLEKRFGNKNTFIRMNKKSLNNKIRLTNKYAIMVLYIVN